MLQFAVDIRDRLIEQQQMIDRLQLEQARLAAEFGAGAAHRARRTSSPSLLPPRHHGAGTPAGLERWACDSSLSRVLLQDSVVIDAGRSRRVVSGAARKTLSVRDGHCRWPGCARPASWCDGHHVVHWIEGGETDVGNLVLLCRRHHRLVHEGGWQLIKTEDGELVTVAPTVRFGSPRGPD